MKAAPNPFGVTQLNTWSDLSPSDPLEQQLAKQAIPFETVDRRLTAKPVTVLVVPVRYEIDAWAEDYFYCEGMTRDEALRDESHWLRVYDHRREFLPAEPAS